MKVKCQKELKAHL